MIAARTRAVALLSAAVLAGAAGGAWAVAGAPVPDRVTALTVADTDDQGEAAESAEPEDAGKPSDAGRPTGKGKPADKGKPATAGKSGGADKAGKRSGTGRPAGAGVHGACVSAVARSDATAGKADNHGGAVSRAAETCPHPTPSPSVTR